MQPKVSPLRATLGRIAGIGVGLGLILLALMASLVVLQVAARNFLDLGLPWADELARFSGIGLVFLSVPALAGRQALVSVTLLPDMLGKRPAQWLALLADIATLAFGVLLLWSFAEFLPRAGKFLTPAMQVPNWFYYSLALTGSLFMTLVALERIVATLRGASPSAPYGTPSGKEALETT